MTLPHASVTVLPAAIRTVNPPQTDRTTLAVPDPVTVKVTPSVPASVAVTVKPAGIVVTVPDNVSDGSSEFVRVYDADVVAMRPAASVAVTENVWSPMVDVSIGDPF